MQAQEEEALRDAAAALAARTAAIQGLASMVGDPQDLWQAAVQLAKTYTSAAGKQGPPAEWSAQKASGRTKLLAGPSSCHSK